ncbi:MAG: hypothetical protein D4R44_04060 [Actinobacteria bacterium]|nr:MAG: hypothetical protein D4R44_04060 [Actinomycetota bacterium]
MATGVLTPAANPPVSGGGDYSVTNADVAAGGKITSTIDANGITNPAPVVFNEVTTANRFTGSGCTPADYTDFIYGIGFNLSNTFTRINTGYPMTFLGFESDFCTGASKESEFYYRQIDTAGTLRNLWGMNVSHDGVLVTASQMFSLNSWLDPSNNLWAKWNMNAGSPVWDFFSVAGVGPQLRFGKNNQAFSSQRNAADSAYLSLPYFDSTNRYVLGAAQSPVIWQASRAAATSNYYDMAVADTPTSGDRIVNLNYGTVTGFVYPFYMTGSATTGTVLLVTNTNAGGNADAMIELSTTSVTGGDAYIRMGNGTTSWAAGLDNDSATDVYVISNSASAGSSNAVSFATGTLLGQMTLTGQTFANIGTPANGTIAYCSDCTIANPCVGGGTGAIGKRLNGVWVCN